MCRIMSFVEFYHDYSPCHFFIHSITWQVTFNLSATMVCCMIGVGLSIGMIMRKRDICLDCGCHPGMQDRCQMFFWRDMEAHWKLETEVEFVFLGLNGLPH